jgi:tRNA pseudouridine38-40 synthase
MTSLHRFKLTIEYEGTHFSGFQRQENAPSIQESIETAITAFTGLPTTLFVAGRTDAGVHAKGQVAHVDVPTHIDARTMERATNTHLKDHPIVILKAEQVSNDFHARFDAKKRSYTYRIINRRPPLTFEKNLAWHVPYPLNVQAMQEAAPCLLGCHDFSTFRATHCQGKSPIRTLDEIQIEQQGDLILIHVSALSFLYHQVRNMVGSLVLVGRGKWTATDLEQALKACDRKAGGPTAPPDGLYFMEVRYDGETNFLD